LCFKNRDAGTGPATQVAQLPRCPLQLPAGGRTRPRRAASYRAPLHHLQALAAANGGLKEWFRGARSSRSASDAGRPPSGGLAGGRVLGRLLARISSFRSTTFGSTGWAADSRLMKSGATVPSVKAVPGDAGTNQRLTGGVEDVRCEAMMSAAFSTTQQEPREIPGCTRVRQPRRELSSKMRSLTASHAAPGGS